MTHQHLPPNGTQHYDDKSTLIHRYGALSRDIDAVIQGNPDRMPWTKYSYL